jgi:hypothetical protein
MGVWDPEIVAGVPRAVATDPVNNKKRKRWGGFAFCVGEGLGRPPKSKKKAGVRSALRPRACEVRGLAPSQRLGAALGLTCRSSNDEEASGTATVPSPTAVIVPTVSTYPLLMGTSLRERPLAFPERRCPVAARPFGIFDVVWDRVWIYRRMINN